jgi:2-polyprenyl-3-methyl-5-hydroxy-6-metoxy-1,4-benzoquinol methylase
MRAAMTRTDEPAACPVCAAPTFRRAFTVEGYTFERCPGCGFVRMADAPDTSRLLDFYRDDQATAASAQEDHDRNLRRFDTILQHIERHRRPGRFLDVGCSIGTSLVAARRRGWTAVGVELALPAVEFGRTRFSVDVRATTLAEAGFEPGSFDAVLMHHVLEHVEGPDRVVQQVAEVLAPGGIMYQSLPNHASLKSLLLGRYFGYGITNEHLSHFTPRTLRQLVRRAGLEPLESFTLSYRQDPRMVWDFCRRLGLRRWLERKCGLRPGQEMDIATYVAFLARTKWALFVCNRVWPQRLCRWLYLGEDQHLIARKPAGS